MSYKDLELAEDKVKTSMGRSFLSERVVFRGKDLHFELGDKSWVELYSYGITGKIFSEEQVKLLNFIWVSTSYPDKSIWPNHITALAGSARTSPHLAMAAGVASCDASIFGGKPFKVALDFFVRLKKHVDSGLELATFVKTEIELHGVIFGYGRPLASTDERVPHLIHFVKKLGLDNLAHFELALSVANLLKEEKQINMNVAALYAALGADLGFTAKQFHIFMTLCFVAGMPPCYIDANNGVEGTFLPVRCDRVNYTGKPKRNW